MSNTRFTFFGVVLTLVTLGVGWGFGHRWRKRTLPERRDMGTLLFQVHCASCHGAEGKGDGFAAAALNPPPRDFASRPWRFEPTTAAIRRVTLDGIPQTAMPGFAKSLSAEDVEALVAHVQRLAGNAPGGGEPNGLRAAGFTDLRRAPPPPLTLIDADDNSFDLATSRGRLLVLHFWGTSCIHCVKEIPALVELERMHGDKLQVIHICADGEDAKAAQEYLSGVAPGVRTYVDADGLGLARFEVHALPTVWLIAADGKAIARASGAKDWRSPTLTDVIRRNLPN